MKALHYLLLNYIYFKSKLIASMNSKSINHIYDSSYELEILYNTEPNILFINLKRKMNYCFV